MKEVIELLKCQNKTISTMESCTGGAFANAITDIEGASDVLKFSAVTYSNEYKIKMGISPKTIEKYSIYSIETAREMAYNISLFTNSDIGIGITGKLNRIDNSNKFGANNRVYISIYHDKKYDDIIIDVEKKSRKDNKNVIIENIIKKLKVILDEKN